MVHLIVVALGGNAIVPRDGAGTIDQQIDVTRRTMQHVAGMISDGNSVVLTHGNGPIVGNILIRNELASGVVPPMPLDICGADSQGGIGYMVQQALGSILRVRHIDKSVVSLVTQVVVSLEDQAFRKPTKPIGPFYGKDEASALARDKGWSVVEDSGRGYRRVVASPKPLEIVEKAVVERLVREGVVVVCAGGGGIPVVRDAHGTLRGVEAVIDKDLAAGLLASELRADMLVLVTPVNQVFLDFGKPDQRGIDFMSVDDARRYLDEGQFPPGSMGPKIEAAISFLESGGKEVVVTSPEQLHRAVAGGSGTRISKQ
jgi:carbamate kinase